jgi:sugar lactone lactonase YvrE
MRRPECVVPWHDGTILASDKSAIVTVISGEGEQARLGSGAALANTFAVADDGTLLVADLKRGAILRMAHDGTASLLYDTFEGEALGSVNFVLAGEEPGAFWFSVATCAADFRDAIASPRPDGRIFRIDRNGLALVADGLFFPNAMQVDHERGHIYVAETTAGAIARASIDTNGTIGAFERFGPAPLYAGAYTDGLAIDCEGNVWITELSRHAILLLGPDGTMHTVFEDPQATTLQSPTHLAFGGQDLRTVFVGSLKMAVIPAFRSPVAGLATRHWRRRTPLAFPDITADGAADTETSATTR